MSRENIIWLVLFILGGVFLLGRVVMTDHGMGRAYVEEKQIDQVYVAPDAEKPDEKAWISAEDAGEKGITLPAVDSQERVQWKSYENSNLKEYSEAQSKDANQTTHQQSLWRTFGIWLAAAFTLFILSFLIRDNPLYKVSESLFIGISAAYWMVVGFWDTVVPNLIGKLSPSLVRAWAMPGLGSKEEVELWYLVPLVLGIMLLWRLAPVGGWISRWPMAFIIGVFCGLRLITFLHADFLLQIRNSVDSLYKVDQGSFDFWGSFSAVILILGVLACLTYFFFSFEHKGFVGKTAKVGIWVLMITFGAAFGYTVMGRIALLAIRIEFLFDDWLWLIDPKGTRAIVGMLFGL